MSPAIPTEVVGELRRHLIRSIANIQRIAEMRNARDRDRRPRASRLEPILRLASRRNLQAGLVDRISGKNAYELYGPSMRSIGKLERSVEQWAVPVIGLLDPPADICVRPTKRFSELAVQPDVLHQFAREIGDRGEKTAIDDVTLDFANQIST